MIFLGYKMRWKEQKMAEKEEKISLAITLRFLGNHSLEEDNHTLKGSIIDTETFIRIFFLHFEKDICIDSYYPSLIGQLS